MYWSHIPNLIWQGNQNFWWCVQWDFVLICRPVDCHKLTWSICSGPAPAYLNFEETFLNPLGIYLVWTFNLIFLRPVRTNTPLYPNGIMSFTFLLERRLILLKLPHTHSRWIKDVLHHISFDSPWKVQWEKKQSVGTPFRNHCPRGWNLLTFVILWTFP